MNPEESKWQTRRDRINGKLVSLPQPWKLVKYHPSLNLAQCNRHAVEEFPTDNGPADYALFVRGELLGLIEAKKVSVGSQNVLVMTMGPFEGNPEEARPYFKITKQLFEAFKASGLPGVEMTWLSMGMTNSYRIAIEEGANMVRIGTKIFGPRS